MSNHLSRKRFSVTSAAASATIGFVRAPAKAAQFTSGVLDVQVYPNNQLGGDTAVLGQLRCGAIQFCTLDGGILQSVVPVAAIQGVGFALKDPADAFKAFDGSLGAYVRQDIEAKGLFAFPKVWENGMRQITTSTHQIRTAAELDGMKIGTPAGKLWVDPFQLARRSPDSDRFQRGESIRRHRLGASVRGAEVFERDQPHVVRFLAARKPRCVESASGLGPVGGRAQRREGRRVAARGHCVAQRLARRQARAPRHDAQHGGQVDFPGQARRLLQALEGRVRRNCVGIARKPEW